MFSLAGTVSLIRYRSVPGDPKDIAYILLCAAAGLAAGIGFYLYGALGVVLLCVLMILLNKFNFASSFEAQKILKVTIPEPSKIIRVCLMIRSKNIRPPVL